MPNEITQRIYDHIKDLPPFAYVGDREILLRVAARVEVKYYVSGSEVFRAGAAPGDRFYLVREGAVDLVAEREGTEHLIERCGEGEVFGIRPLLATDNYRLTARAAEETLLYAFNSEGFAELLPRYPALLTFLATSMAGASRYSITQHPAVDAAPVAPGKTSPPDSDNHLDGLLGVASTRAPITCPPTSRIREAARRMTEEQIGSIIITDRENRPIGIITDRDLRRKVATGKVSPESFVTEIMRGPVRCIPRKVTVADVQITMATYGINHLVQTEDGTPGAAVIGVISRHDLMVLQGNNPAVLIREIQRAKSTTYLATLRLRAEHLLGSYLDKEVSISFITTVMTRINDAVVRKCIKLALAKMQAAGMGNPPAPFDWLCLGSLGREEQLLRTDQDTALIFQDVPSARYNHVKQYFVQFAGHVTEYLYQSGFDYCPGDMMASNPKYCMSVRGWKEQFSTWMAEVSPESMLNTSIFFDFRGVWGDGSLPQQLTEHIFSEVSRRSTRFLASLAQVAIDNPSPLTFFRNFVVERSGEYKDAFDLKSRAMRPLTDAARVLMLNARQGHVNNTFRRFEFLAELEPQNAELYQAAAEAYEILMRLRATVGLREGSAGRYLKPSELTRLQRLRLRNSFGPVKDVQTLLELRFQLNFLK